jgi:serine/threonine protein kinase
LLEEVYLSHEAELLSLISKSFPSLGAEVSKRVEALGVYAASSWTVGPERLTRSGVQIPPPVHEALQDMAAKVAASRQGGTTFLCHVRHRLDNDSGFVSSVGALARAQEQARSGRGSRATASAAHPVQVAGFEVFDKIGEGNMGRVYKARQTSLDREVALKVLNRSLEEEDETFVARFELEAKSAARLQHPNIVSVIDAGICPRTKVQFIAMELITGESVAEMLVAQGKLNEHEALALCLAMTEALNCAEKHGIVHRDLKPDNILVGLDGIPRLTDLGLAKKREAKELTSDGLIVGTPHYMSPEQALGLKEVDGRSDLYSLGITLFQLLTGRMPFESESAVGVITMHVNRDVPDVRTFEPKVSAGTSQVIAGLCARKRDERYPNARAAGGDIQRAATGLTPLGPAGAGRAAEEAAASSGRIRMPSISGSFVRAGAEGSAVRPLELQPPPELDASDAALWRFEGTGYLPHLDDAEAALGEGPEAMTLARRARIQLLRGDAGAASKAAQAALAVDPAQALALVVLAGLDRGEATAAEFRAALRRLTSQVGALRSSEARSVGAQLRRDHPSEPHPHLALALVASRNEDDAAFRESVQLAWALFPSRTYLHVRLGSGVDLHAAQALVEFGRKALASEDPATRLRTVQNTEDKGNLIAGAPRMGVGLVHAALSDCRWEPPVMREHLFALVSGLMALQHLSQAQEVLTRLRRLEPTPDEVRVIDEEERILAGLKGVTQAGIQPQRGRFPCPVYKARYAALRDRAKLLEKRRKEYLAETGSACERISTIGMEDSSARAEIQAVAQAIPLDDPFAPIDAIDADLAQVATDLGAFTEQAPPEKKATGFFNRLKGAADAAGRAAKTGRLKLRETQLRMSRNKALKALGVSVGHDLGTYAYSHSELSATVRRVRHLSALVEQVEREHTEVRKRLEQLG